MENTNICVSSFFFLIEEFIENELFQASLQNSMDTYNDELFSKRIELRPSNLFQFHLTQQDLETIKEEKQCFICLEDLVLNDLVTKLKCNHIFHKHCMEDLMEHQHKQCPLCREQLQIQKEDEKCEQYKTEQGHEITFFLKE